MTENKIIDSLKLINIMEERAADKSCHTPNSVDIGYDLAVGHMKEEIDNIEEADAIPVDNIVLLINEVKSKKRKHEYGGFEITRLSIDEFLSMVEKYTGIFVPDKPEKKDD